MKGKGEKKKKRGKDEREGETKGREEDKTIKTHFFLRPLFLLVSSHKIKKPPRQTIADSVKKTRKVLVVEECMKTGGIGASLSAQIGEQLFDDLDHQVVRLSSQDVPTAYAYELEAATIVQPEAVVAAVQRIVGAAVPA